MFTDLLWSVAYQHVTEMQEEAATRLRAREARQARRAGRRGHHDPGPLATVRVPDYVDGTFRTGAGPAGTAHREDGATVSRNAA
ncbi:MAG TPA: hypothetical protein VKV33_00230 [Streptosporangiaceae bacterium]|nr:hypothetical protein [Streptosporangiaceae bacterium]